MHLRPDVQTKVIPEDREMQPNKPFLVIPAGPHVGGLGAEMLIIVATRH